MTPTHQGPTSALIISGSVGAGHDGAAHELARRLRGHGLVVDVRDYLDAMPWLCAFLLRTGYTGTVGKVPSVFEWLYGALERSPLVLAATLAFCRLGERTITRWTRRRPYAFVVSTYPLASQCLGHLRERGSLDVPVLTYLTDPAAHRTWVHSGVDHHLTVTADAARAGHATYGLTMHGAGPLVPQRFSTPVPGRASQLRRELDLPDRAKVALIVTGSLGLGDIDHTVRLVTAAGMTPVVLCGRSERLRRRTSRLPGVRALGWRTDVHELMQAADVLVHNAGGLTFTEALVAGLPAVSYRCIPGHGLANAAALERAGLAPWARSPEEFTAALWLQATRARSVPQLPDPAAHILAAVGLASGRASAPPVRLSPSIEVRVRPLASSGERGTGGRGAS